MRTSGAGALLGGFALLLAACSGGGDGAANGTAGRDDTARRRARAPRPSTTAGSAPTSTATTAAGHAAAARAVALPGRDPRRRRVLSDRRAGRLVAARRCHRLAPDRRPSGHRHGTAAGRHRGARRRSGLRRARRRRALQHLAAASRTRHRALRPAGDRPGRAVAGVPGADAAWEANLQRDVPFAVERAAIVDGLTACRRRLEAAGIDLGDYDTEASVRDLDQIRAALGYDRWNLLGISYGARLSLAAMRSTPEHLRSVILDSVYDVTGGGLAAQAASAERAFRQLADGCAADPTCHAAHPDVAATIDAVRQRYNATPIQVDVDLERGAGPQHWVITGDDAMAGLFNALYDASLIPALPAILDGLAAGDTAIVPALIRRGVGFADRGRGRDADVGRLRRQRGPRRGGRRGGHRRPGPDPPDRDQRALLRVAGAGDLAELQRARRLARAHVGAGRRVRPDHPAGRHPGGRGAAAPRRVRLVAQPRPRGDRRSVRAGRSRPRSWPIPPHRSTWAAWRRCPGRPSPDGRAR